MATKIKGITLTIGGDTTGLTKALKSVNKETSDIQRELKEVEQALKLNPKSTELLAQKQKLLSENIATTEKKLEALKKAKADADKRMASGDTETAEKQYRKLQREISNTEKALESLKEEQTKNSQGFEKFKDVLPKVATAATAVTAAVMGTALGLSSLEEETREYREALNKLDATFSASGKSIESGRQAYSDFYAILGEEDRAIEAVGHLAQLTKNQEQLTQWTTIATGVTATFGDSLPIEGLTEAANETSKVAKVTGVLADAYNWIGISEDDVNEKLEKLTTEQERAEYITTTLAEAYSNSAGIYTKMNESVMQSREAQQHWNDALSAAGEVIAPLKTKVIDFGAGLLENVIATITAKDETTELIQTIKEENSAYWEAKEAQEAKTQAAVAEIDYTARLYNELKTLSDENGNVTETNKLRAEYIIGELNEALGLELKLTNNQIEGYRNLCASIEQVIQQRRATIILESQEESYKNATLEINEKLAEQDKLRLEIMETEASYEKLRTSTSIEGAKAAEQTRMKLSELQATYKENDEVINGYYADIYEYESNYTALMSGDADKIKQINNSVGESFKIAGDATEEELQKQVMQTGLAYAEIQKKVDEGVKGVTQEMADEALVQYEMACTEYKKIGKAIPEGMQVGIENGKPTLKAKIGSFVAEIKSWFTGASGFDTHSPSKWSEQIGKWVDEGLINGIVAEKALVKKTFSDLFNVAEKSYDDLTEEEKEYLRAKEQIEQESADKAYAEKIANANKEFQTSKEKAAATLEEELKNAKNKAEIENAYAKEIKSIKTAEAKYEEELTKIKNDKIAKTEEEANKAYLEGLKSTADEAKKKREEIRSYYKGMLDDVQGLIDNLNTKIDSYAEGLADTELVKSITTKVSYDTEFYNYAQKNLSPAELEKLVIPDSDGTVSSTKYVLADLSPKLKELEKFRDNIADLKELGIDDTMIEIIKQLGGDEGGQLTEALLQATPEQRDKFVSDYKKISELSAEGASEVFQSEIEKTGKQVKNTLEALNPDLLKIGEDWGTILGDGIISKLSEALKSMDNIVSKTGYGGFTGNVTYSTQITQNIGTASPTTAYETAIETERVMNNLEQMAVLS